MRQHPHRRWRAHHRVGDDCNGRNGCTAIRIHRSRPGRHWCGTALVTLPGPLKSRRGNWLSTAERSCQQGESGFIFNFAIPNIPNANMRMRIRSGRFGEYLCSLYVQTFLANRILHLMHLFSFRFDCDLDHLLTQMGVNLRM